ncbi:MAG: universal stress protein [Bacteroidota bacterium]|nr:universal stress protein [Bacteroidota bacterium]MDX5431715.1 universal stress protein [Bacteroidota bacterium]MDX5470430.1 universal stress protein [Bacteroidota bacterium]
MAFIKRILVPTDFSEPAVNALRYANMLALLTGAEVKVLHIFNVPVVDPYMPGDTLELLMQEVKAASDAKLKELLAEFPGVQGECMHGFVIDDTIRSAEEWEADLIVMGTTGATGAKEVFFGSNASGVISQSPIKVLSIPASYTTHKSPSKICYASDFTGAEELQFQIFIDLAKSWNCDLDILHVVSDDLVFIADKAEAIYNKIAQTAQFDRMHFEEISSNEVAGAIETYVQAKDMDILGMAVHRRNLLERLFSKSMTRTIAHHAKIPLLSIKKG